MAYLLTPLSIEVLQSEEFIGRPSLSSWTTTCRRFASSRLVVRLSRPGGLLASCAGPVRLLAWALLASRVPCLCGLFFVCFLGHILWLLLCLHFSACSLFAILHAVCPPPFLHVLCLPFSCSLFHCSLLIFPLDLWIFFVCMFVRCFFLYVLKLPICTFISCLFLYAPSLLSLFSFFRCFLHAVCSLVACYCTFLFSSCVLKRSFSRTRSCFLLHSSCFLFFYHLLVRSFIAFLSYLCLLFPLARSLIFHVQLYSSSCLSVGYFLCFSHSFVSFPLSCSFILSPCTLLFLFSLSRSFTAFLSHVRVSFSPLPSPLFSLTFVHSYLPIPSFGTFRTFVP